MGSMPFHYRQQRSCGKVMFLHVCHPVRGGWGLADRHSRADTPPGRPPPLAGRHPLRWVDPHPGRQTPPPVADPPRQADTPP